MSLSEKEGLYYFSSKLEDLLKDKIRETTEKVLAKRKASNESTWKHATEANASEFLDRVTHQIEELENLYEEIESWPDGVEDE
jgi:hypothetical protein